MRPQTYCGCGCDECINGHHCQTNLTWRTYAETNTSPTTTWHCNYTDNMTGPIGLIPTS